MSASLCGSYFQGTIQAVCPVRNSAENLFESPGLGGAINSNERRLLMKKPIVHFVVFAVKHSLL